MNIKDMFIYIFIISILVILTECNYTCIVNYSVNNKKCVGVFVNPWKLLTDKTCLYQNNILLNIDKINEIDVSGYVQIKKETKLNKNKLYLYNLMIIYFIDYEYECNKYFSVANTILKNTSSLQIYNQVNKTIETNFELVKNKDCYIPRGSYDISIGNPIFTKDYKVYEIMSNGYASMIDYKDYKKINQLIKKYLESYINILETSILKFYNNLVL